jgi:hypothetical protein
MTDAIELAGVLPSGVLYRGTVNANRINLTIKGVHYWVWADVRGITAGWSAPHNRDDAK